jgi:transaldolase
MERQAYNIAGWSKNVYVKVPVTNTHRESSMKLIQLLAHSGVKVNVTAILTLDRARDACAALAEGAPSVVSVFAGRVADTGRDPVPLMAAVELVSAYSDIELLWAGPRELLNICQANDVGCHVITATDGVLAELQAAGKDLHDYSLETVKMFHTDAAHSGYQL